ncbi:MAG: rdgB [Gammaproteobacteria bacterium]|nr:rdgB [Gammaproteobacteria bacterium]
MKKLSRLVLASNNQGKIEEFQPLLAPLGIELISQAALGIESVEETGLSFIENALIKARHACAHSGLPTLADDSGLSVAALNGAPGIYSARIAGSNATDDEKVQALLQQMQSVDREQRQGCYHCAIVLMQHPLDPIPLIAEGRLEGTVLEEPCGTSGFGFDPVFYLPAQKCTVAQLSLLEKNKISHRALAVAKLLNHLTP